MGDGADADRARVPERAREVGSRATEPESGRKAHHRARAVPEQVQCAGEPPQDELADRPDETTAAPRKRDRVDVVEPEPETIAKVGDALDRERSRLPLAV